MLGGEPPNPRGVQGERDIYILCSGGQHQGAARAPWGWPKMYLFSYYVVIMLNEVENID